MQTVSIFPRSPLSRPYGFSLIEVLVSLLVLSIGLLGLAALQTTGLRFNSQSYQRTQAVLNAYDIIDRIRANPGGMTDGVYNDVNLSPAPFITDCAAINCSTTLMADYDIGQWKESLGNLLPQGQGAICRGALTLNPYACVENAGATLFTVGITWLENDLPMNLMVEAQL